MKKTLILFLFCLFSLVTFAQVNKFNKINVKDTATFESSIVAKDISDDITPKYSIDWDETDSVMTKSEYRAADSIVFGQILISPYRFRVSGDSLFLDSATIEKKVIWPE